MAVRRAMVLAFGLLVVTTPPSRGQAQEPVSTIGRSEHRIPFQARDGLIYIEAQVNGTPTKVLVDTGAVQTMFTIKLVPLSPMRSIFPSKLFRGARPAS